MMNICITLLPLIAIQLWLVAGTAPEGKIIAMRDTCLGHTGYRYNRFASTDRLKSWKECAQLCNRREKCVAWNWYPKAPVKPVKSCELKSVKSWNCDLFDRTGGEYTSASIISGRKYCKPAVTCKQENTGYRYGLTGGVKNIPTWEQCDAICRKNKKCVTWSWFPKTHPIRSWRHVCSFRQRARGKYTSEHAISGVPNCYKNVHTCTGNTGYRHHVMGGGYNVPSWQQCDANCRSNAKCVAWNWHLDTHPVASWRGVCVLFDRTSGPYTEESTISGRKDCGKSGK